MTAEYSELWNSLFRSEYKNDNWAIQDSRLKPFSEISEKWTPRCPLRNDFERRQALLEIDVIVAQAFGLTLDELITIYVSQFDVLKKNEEFTFYDKKGRIVYTKNAGLTGVGVDTKDWNTIKDQVDGETYCHVITKNMLYKNETVIYNAPYKTCDRIADYRRAWAFFEKRLKSE